MTATSHTACPTRSRCATDSGSDPASVSSIVRRSSIARCVRASATSHASKLARSPLSLNTCVAANTTDRLIVTASFRHVTEGDSMSGYATRGRKVASGKMNRIKGSFMRLRAARPSAMAIETSMG